MESRESPAEYGLKRVRPGEHELEGTLALDGRQAADQRRRRGESEELRRAAGGEREHPDLLYTTRSGRGEARFQIRKPDRDLAGHSADLHLRPRARQRL